MERFNRYRKSRNKEDFGMSNEIFIIGIVFIMGIVVGGSFGFIVGLIVGGLI